jgi:hypothetical protein
MEFLPTGKDRVLMNLGKDAGKWGAGKLDLDPLSLLGVCA